MDLSKSCAFISCSGESLVGEVGFINIPVETHRSQGRFVKLVGLGERLASPVASKGLTANYVSSGKSAVLKKETLFLQKGRPLLIADSGDWQRFAPLRRRGLRGAGALRAQTLGSADNPQSDVSGIGDSGSGVTAYGLIEATEVGAILSRSYLEYALSVIHARALPDARDGLKPVHRRILYAMNQLHLDPDGPYRKCARVVGEVLGKYHPHGDSAVYDALVRMAQPFSMLEPLIDGQGNLGSVDGDKAAAMRYTECRLTQLSKQVLLTDIDCDTVDMAPNFDASDMEPTVLPSRLPQLLLNGSSGIAVGMATNIPPHNLRELIAALQALIKNPKLLDIELEALVPAPDFPTGGIIIGLRAARDLHRTGQGSIVLRAKTSFETIRAKNRPVREAIIVTELPYQVNKALLIERIAGLVNEKKLEGIADLRDESDREGMRIVIELKRDADKNIVLNQLFKKTALQSSFNGNMLALVGRRPEKLTLRRALEVFLEHRVHVIQRRCRFELGKAREREHVVQGLLVGVTRHRCHHSNRSRSSRRGACEKGSHECAGALRTHRPSSGCDSFHAAATPYTARGGSPRARASRTHGSNCRPGAHPGQA
ncbi:hypothetical protein F1559_001312 [Cyanidiococcus yangmingshanensis]|uniref:DNA topoisomerase (ATP-hydrolyzing) n=1 Tax=Cyanidiococcus yangmingshanensis TaxID=2690220 RepID=A0A7J7IJG3_9RHOD|nr:hypothetical protein F1559_001312 [Cyanidiococcus yangmingshanensis]